MELSKNGSALTNDSVVGLTTVTYGGTLSLTNLGPTPVTAGDSFKLFSASSYSGAFASIVPATPAPGLVWDTSSLAIDGRLKVAAQPQIRSLKVSGTNVMISGVGGTQGSTYYLLTSTDVALPLSNWTVIATNVFGSGGGFAFTNPVTPNLAQQFYTLKAP